jgi:hypothetical protein
MALSLLSGITGALAGTSAGRTTTLNTNSTGTQSGTSTSTQNLTPYQSSLQSPLFSLITNLMTPQGAQAYVQPFTQASMDSTNSSYGGMANMLRQQFLTTGNGQSGKFGNAMVQGNLQRLGALQGVPNTGQEEAAALPLQASQLATSLLEHPFSQTTSGSSTTTNNGTSSLVGPGSPLIDALLGFNSSLAGNSNMFGNIVSQMLNSPQGSGFAGLGIPSQIPGSSSS